MTCIVAHRDGWMVADRRKMMGNMIAPFVASKVWLTGNFRDHLVGLAGSTDVIYSRITGGLKDPLVDLRNVMRDAPGDDYTAIICNRDGLYQITGDGGSHQLAGDWWAIGSGAEAALGYLAGVARGRARAITAEVAEEAIAFSATLDSGVSVGHGCQVETLNQPPKDEP